SEAIRPCETVYPPPSRLWEPWQPNDRRRTRWRIAPASHYVTKKSEPRPRVRPTRASQYRESPGESGPESVERVRRLPGHRRPQVRCTPRAPASGRRLAAPVARLQPTESFLVRAPGRALILACARTPRLQTLASKP